METKSANFLVVIHNNSSASQGTRIEMHQSVMSKTCLLCSSRILFAFRNLFGRTHLDLKQISKSNWTPMLWVYASKLMICASKLTHSLDWILCGPLSLRPRTQECALDTSLEPILHKAHTFVWLSIGHQLADINQYQLTNVYQLTSIDRLDFRWSI